MRRSAAVLALVVATATTPMGCASEGSVSSGSETTSPSDLHLDPGGDASHLPPIPELEDAVGAVADATFDRCGTSPGSHVVRGTVENSSDETMTYVVAVSWIDEAADVVQRGVSELADVAPGEAVEFAVTAVVPEGVTSCTYYVLRAPNG